MQFWSLVLVNAFIATQEKASPINKICSPGTNDTTGTSDRSK